MSEQIPDCSLWYIHPSFDRRNVSCAWPLIGCGSTTSPGPVGARPGTFPKERGVSRENPRFVHDIPLPDVGNTPGTSPPQYIGGSESDPRAYRFDGELNVANRGLMEFIEMLKSDEKFLYGLLTLSQEQNIKTGRFAMIYADEVIMSHTNETEYLHFIENKKMRHYATE